MPFVMNWRFGGEAADTEKLDKRRYQQLPDGPVIVCDPRFGGYAPANESDDSLFRTAQQLPARELPAEKIPPLQLPAQAFPALSETCQKAQVKAHRRESSRWVKISVKSVDVKTKPTKGEEKKVSTNATDKKDDFVIVDSKEECDDDWVFVDSSSI